MELNAEVMAFTSESERQDAQTWVQERAGVRKWGKRWMVVDETHIKIALKPAIMARDTFNYRRVS